MARKSSDLNPTENLCSVLARSVYANSRRFNSVEEPKTELVRCWENNNEEVLHRLINSMPKRCVDIVRMHGSII